MTASVSDHLIERAVRRSGNPQLLERLDKVAGPPAEPGLESNVKPEQPTFEQSSDAAPTLRNTSAAIPLEVMQRAGLVVVGPTRSRMIEEWRVITSGLLRTQPQRTSARALPNSLMVTSSRAREGKSFCTLNLAATVAQSRNVDTIIVDLDAKYGSLSTLLGLADAPGLLQLALDPSLSIDSAIAQTAVPHLSILPLGVGSGKGADAGVTKPVATALERLARRFPDRLLILDTAPCLATSDASTLAQFVGQIAVIVEAEITQKSDLESTLELLVSCDAVALVLNKAREQASGHFGTQYFGYYDQGS